MRNDKPSEDNDNARRFCDLPDVMTAADVISFLPIGRDAVYHDLATGQLPAKRRGQKWLICKAALREYLGGAVE